MEAAFYSSGLVAVLASLAVIVNPHPVHALLYLVVSLIAVAMVFFALGAPFAGALEIIVYAGAILVLFVFVVMMLNLAGDRDRERTWWRPLAWAGPAGLAALLLAVLVATLWWGDGGRGIAGETLTAHGVGTTLFGPWLVAVELSAFLLLAALVTASHLGQSAGPGEPVDGEETP